MTIHKALRAKAAMNRVAKKKNMVEVGIGVLTLASIFMSEGKKTTPKKGKWGYKGH